MSIAVFDEETGEPLRPGDPRWKEVWEDLVAKGVIVPDKDAPSCMGCQEKLDQIHVKVMSDLIAGDDDATIVEDDFTWIPGLHQFNVSPGFFGFVTEGWAHFEASCSACGAYVAGLEIVERPHGLTFTEESRMAGNL